ncbi:hypothetical protein V2J09_016687 [Rumex salicifolius]
MQAIPRLKHLANLRNSAATPLASFHSTPVSDDKWKKNWNSACNKGQHQQPSKSYIRYVTRQRRAEAKRALNSLLFNGGPFQTASEHATRPKRKKVKKSSCNSDLEDDTDSSTQAGRSSTSHSKKTKTKQRRKQRKEYATEDDEQHETIFQAKFGNRWYSWSFNAFHSSSFYRSTSGFGWKENTQNRNDRQNWWEEVDSDNEREQVGSHSDRTVLGLPPYGPLKIEDVKSAFRLSALKWHPDKHQGPSQAQAEEKFKLCVNAYKSLCSAVSAA